MAKKTLLKVPELSDDSGRFLKDLQKETDRGAVLVASAFLDDALASLLRSFFVDDSKHNSDLFNDGNSFVGTFSSKIKLMYSLGLINKKCREDLENIKKTRNDFAHSHTLVSLEDRKIKSRCKSLNGHKLISSELGIDSGRNYFILTVATWMNVIIIQGLTQKHQICPKMPGDKK